MPVQSGNPIRPLKVESKLQAIPELPEDSDLISIRDSALREKTQILDVLTASPDCIQSNFPKDNICVGDEAKKVKEKHAFEMEAVVLSSSHKGTITNENV